MGAATGACPREGCGVAAGDRAADWPEPTILPTMHRALGLVLKVLCGQVRT